MKQFLLFLSVFFFGLPLSAQKACFIKGSFIAAVYTEPDHKIKFLNTFTNQVFSSFEYSDAEPQMWFAENQLVVISGKQMTVAVFKTHKNISMQLRVSQFPALCWSWLITETQQ